MTEETTSQALRFFVYIIESPSAPDIYHGRSEGALVAKAVELDGIPSATRTVINLGSSAESVGGLWLR